MQIQKLSVSGFRSLRDVKWRPDQINVVIGANGTGKSNLMRVLELLTASATGRLAKYVQDAGGMEPLVWDGQANQIYLRLRTMPIDGLAYHPELTYDLSLKDWGLVAPIR